MDILLNVLVTLSRGILGVVVAGIALILMILALVRKDASMMTFAALFAVPSTYVFGAWAGFLLAIRLSPLFLLGSAFFISRDEPIFAWILPVPVFGFLVYFLVTLVAAGFTGV
ncbi:MAG: hypothetical protein HND47_08735 [Chloroflexi bacterium]|nr:hypothetical protein [Chloroflexota bacterium]